MVKKTKKYTRIGGMNKDKSRHKKAHIILGQNIRNIREAKNISQEELAFKLSSARNYIGCVERGEKFPSLDFIFDIALALNVDAREFFEF